MPLNRDCQTTTKTRPEQPRVTGKVFFFRRGITLAIAVLALAISGMAQKKKMSGNPISPGWYANPGAIVYNGEYWMFLTHSTPFDEQTFLDAFSSPDLMGWTEHSRVLGNLNAKWVQHVMWALAAIRANDKYCLSFGRSGVHQGEAGGVDIAVTGRPKDSYRDTLGKPLISEIVNRAQPIDQFVFKDGGGQYCIHYGGWEHYSMVKLAPDLSSLVPFPDGVMFKEVTPKNYVEGPFMLKEDGEYYLIWLKGRWTGSDYCVIYAISGSSFGPFERIGKILERNDKIAWGVGHHSVIRSNGKDEWYIVYHRHLLAGTDKNHREACIDRMYFDESDFIKPIKMTIEGIKKAKKRKQEG